MLTYLVRKISPDSRWLPVIIGMAVVGEWHLLWAAASGMETVLFVWLSILLMERFAAWKEMPSSRRMGALGLIGGLLTLTRPEGIGLAGLIGLAMVWQYRADARRLRRTILPFGLGFALPLIPYFAFNFAVSGLIFPNTFYAKQREYAILLENIPLWKRWLSVGGVQFVGGQILLLPGAIFGLWQAFRLKKTMPMIAATWWLTHVSLYALRLPATYQHGRYEMPTLPWLIFFGIWGTAQFLKPNHPVTWMRMLSHTGIAAIGAAIAAFVWLGVQSYANDVTFIDTEMVKTARWIDANTAPNAVIAAHDIGAIGYFSARPLVDLAGLVTPAVIPFIRDESALLEFSRARGAQYLVTFPSWYPQMTAALPEVYRTNSVWAKKHQHDNMAVFKIVDKRN